MNLVKGCPHCGSESYLQSSYNRKYGIFFVSVKCSFCGATGQVFTDKESPDEADWDTEACRNAVRAWNMRHYEEE